MYVYAWDTRRATQSCPFCGMTIQELSKTARVGCAKCYEVFANQLAPYIRQIHGQAEYVGDLPHEYVSPVTDRLRKLQHDMHRAIKQEDFEEAARLRDEIKSMEVQE